MKSIAKLLLALLLTAGLWSHQAEAQISGGGTSNGVTQIVQGTGISISPTNGRGAVTVSATGSNGFPITLGSTSIAASSTTTAFAGFTTLNGNTVPMATDTFALLTANQTLTNKTFNTASNTFQIAGTTMANIGNGLQISTNNLQVNQGASFTWTGVHVFSGNPVTFQAATGASVTNGALFKTTATATLGAPKYSTSVELDGNAYNGGSQVSKFKIYDRTTSNDLGGVYGHLQIDSTFGGSSNNDIFDLDDHGNLIIAASLIIGSSLSSGPLTVSGGITNNGGLTLQGNTNAFAIPFIVGDANLTTGRQLQFFFGSDASATLTITGANSKVNQDVTTTGNPTFNSVKTSNPASGTAAAWKLGSFVAGPPTGTSGYAQIDVAGTGYQVPVGPSTIIPGFGRVTAQTAAATVETYTVGSADASFIVSSNVLVTASTTNSFTETCTYTDESNTSRTLTLSFSNIAGTFLQTITNVTGTGAYEGVPLHIRAKAATTITFATTGTFTSVTYNAEAAVQQIN